jgi:pyruvate carboxylase
MWRMLAMLPAGGSYQPAVAGCAWWPRCKGTGAGHRAGPAERVQELSNYWADVRLRYERLRPRPEESGTTDIYRYEIPGGQYTNLYGPRWSRSVWATDSRRSRRCTRP